MYFQELRNGTKTSLMSKDLFGGLKHHKPF